MRKVLATVIFTTLISGCASTEDLAKTLRYANNNPVGIDHIKFQEINTMRRGTACTWNFLYFIPLFGDASIITAADNGKIDTVVLIGETGRWYFPFSKNCTVVFGERKY